MLEYRKTTMNDFNTIVKMKNEVKEDVIKANLPIWQNGYPEDDLIKDDIEKDMGRVLVNDGEIVAYLSYYPSVYDYDPGTFPSDDLMSFGRVMTKVSAQGKGYASILIDHVIDEAKDNHEIGMGILVDGFNKKALGIYLKHGFVKIGTGVFPWATLDKYLLMFNYE